LNFENDSLNELCIIILVHPISFLYYFGWLLIIRSHPICVYYHHHVLSSTMELLNALFGCAFVLFEGVEDWIGDCFSPAWSPWEILCSGFQLFSARDMAQKTVIGKDQIVYSTDKDLLEQDYEAREWDTKFRELERSD